MDEQRMWIGIDVAKAWLDVAATSLTHPWQVANDDDGIASLVAELRARPPRPIVFGSHRWP